VNVISPFPNIEEKMSPDQRVQLQMTSNGNTSETKANESFDNGVFFDIEAKRTPWIVIIFKTKRTH
jgi:hypothetical protein